jgi:tol-pal system protein YbgF
MRAGKVAVLLGGLTVLPAASPAQQYQQAYDQLGGYGAETLDERVARLEKRLSGETMVQMLNRIDQLQRDVLKLHGQIEELEHALQTVKKQQKDMYLDLEQRLQSGAGGTAGSEQPEEGAEVPPASSDTDAPQPSPSASVPQRPAAAPGDAAGRQAAYQKAFNTLKDGKYSDAIKEFKSFLAAYPSGEYVDNATYWLAEAHYVNRDFSAARDAFRKVAREFPQSAKVPDALLKTGFIEYETGQWSKAREILSDVVRRYPDTSAAKLAEKRLAKMKQEGR